MSTRENNNKITKHDEDLINILGQNIENYNKLFEQHYSELSMDETNYNQNDIVISLLTDEKGQIIKKINLRELYND